MDSSWVSSVRGRETNMCGQREGECKYRQRAVRTEAGGQAECIVGWDGGNYGGMIKYVGNGCYFSGWITWCDLLSEKPSQ